MEKMSAEIPTLKKVDILVLGGSLSGIASAISAKSHAVDVMLVEDKGFLGGALTASYEAVSYSWDKMDIGEELHSLLYEKGVLDDHFAHLERLKTALEDLCKEKGLPLLFWCKPVDVMVENNKVKGVIFISKGGIFAIECRILIDATPFAQATSPFLLTSRPFPYIESRGFITLTENLISPLPRSLLLYQESPQREERYCRLLLLREGTTSPLEFSQRAGELTETLVDNFHPLATAPFSTFAPLRYPPTYRSLYLSDAVEGKKVRHPIARGKGTIFAMHSQLGIKKWESKEVELDKEFFLSRQLGNLIFTFGDKLPLRPGVAWLESIGLSWEVGKALGTLSALSLKSGLSPHAVKGSDLGKELSGD